MNPIIATVDTRISSYSSIGTINVLDDATIDLTILTNGIVNAPWIEPEFQLIGVKADKNEVRQLDGFNVTSLENRTLAIKLKNEMLTYPGMLKLQLITKDSGRTSTTVFYLYVGQSLEHDIVSHRDVKVLDDLEAYVEKANHNLEIYEQRMDIRDEQFNNLNELMNQAEAKRNQAELNRQQIFDVNEASRTRTFNNQMNNQETSFNDVQIERANEFERDQTKRADDFVQAQNNREQAFNESQSANQSTFNSNEKKRQDEFNANQVANQKIFNDSESARARTFEVAESERCENEKTRKEDESKRVSDEVKRVEAENKRQQKMQEFEDIANQIASDLQEQVTRVDEFVTANELRLLEEDARIDYMGNQQNSIRKVNEANVDYAVKTAIGEFNYLDYEGQHITANNSIEGHTKSAILKGNTLVNLIGQPHSISQFWEEDERNYHLNLLSGNGQPTITYKLLHTLPANNTYTLFIKMSNFEKGILHINLRNSINNADSSNQGYFGVNGWQKIVFKTTAESSYIRMFPRNGTDNVYSISKQFILLEGDYTNKDVPNYFEGMQSVKMPVLTTTGKNLWNNYTLERGSINHLSGDNLNQYTTQTRSKDYIPIVQNTKYIATSYGVDGTTSSDLIRYYDSEKKFIGTSPNEKSTFLRTVFQMDIDNISHIQLEQGAVATPYEPYKSNILSTPSDLILGGIGDVYDTLDLLTGEVVESTKEIVLDGSESWKITSDTLSTVYRFYLTHDSLPQPSKPSGKIICKSLPIGNNVEYESIYLSGSWGIIISISKAKLNSYTLNELKRYLALNPITVRYQLAEKVVKTVDLSDNVVYSYDGTTHYSCSSEEGSLVPTLSVKVPTDVQATIAQQRNTIQALESENEALKDGLIEANQYREDGDMDLLSNQWDIDFRLFEIEMALDVPMMATFKLKEADIMSRYLQAKTLILGGRYERSKMEYQLKRYLEAGQLTQEEYDELISLMDAREMLE